MQWATFFSNFNGVPPLPPSSFQRFAYDVWVPDIAAAIAEQRTAYEKRRERHLKATPGNLLGMQSVAVQSAVALPVDLHTSFPGVLSPSLSPVAPQFCSCSTPQVTVAA